MSKEKFQHNGHTWTVEWQEPSQTQPSVEIIIGSVLARGSRQLMLFMYSTKNNTYAPMSWHSGNAPTGIRTKRDQINKEMKTMNEEHILLEDHPDQGSANARMDVLKKKNPSAQYSTIQGKKSGKWHVVRHTSGGMSMAESVETPSFEDYLSEATLPPHHDAFKRGFKSGVQGGGAAGNENSASVKPELRKHYTAGVNAGKIHTKTHGVQKGYSVDRNGYRKEISGFKKHIEQHAPEAIKKHFGDS